MTAAGRIGEERSVVIAGPLEAGVSLALDGLFRVGSARDAGGLVIGPPHPLYGGSMESPVVTELGFAAARSGLPSLRFDWRGVGASSGEASGEPADHDADYGAALEHLAQTVSGPLCAAGYSAGAAAALRVAARSPRVRRLLLVSPPPALLDAGALLAFRGRVLVVVGDRDRLAPVDALRALLQALPAARIEILPAVDHFFGTGLAELARAVSSWLGPAPDPAQ
jgi:alpha/beta superfamily hydrolase